MIKGRIYGFITVFRVKIITEKFVSFLDALSHPFASCFLLHAYRFGARCSSCIYLCLLRGLNVIVKAVTT